eukprot:jgi/Botrbrau1/19943/Bobra.0059s0060.1
MPGAARRSLKGRWQGLHRLGKQPAVRKRTTLNWESRGLKRAGRGPGGAFWPGGTTDARMTSSDTLLHHHC